MPLAIGRAPAEEQKSARSCSFGVSWHCLEKAAVGIAADTRTPALPSLERCGSAHGRKFREGYQRTLRLGKRSFGG